MEKPTDHTGTIYWGLVLTGTVGYDYWAIKTGHETASAAMRRHTEHPLQKFLLIGAMAGLALHFLSEQYDPGRLFNLGGDNETP